MGWGTGTKDISATPWLRAVSLARGKNSVVAMVTVGIPNFSTLSWSTTSHEVQLPQSHWEPMMMSGFRAANVWANCLLLSGF